LSTLSNNHQISSIASLGQTDKWLKEIFFKALAPTPKTPQSKYSIIFPTPDEIRRSLEGYGSGGSIHMKTQSAPQQKQLQYMRPHLCHWAGDGVSFTSNSIDLSEETSLKREAGRARAAPHIKTYIRYTNAETLDSIDWAMVSSANLSTQAWGAAVNSSGEVRISSWEIGVVVWPELFLDGDTSKAKQAGSLEALMVPCFKRDEPDITQLDSVVSDEALTVVGFRMPYDLPLTPYSASDEPWCATASHPTPDWRGQSWIN
jgi:tyrosyl-DNA phosphodiesterase-1